MPRPALDWVIADTHAFHWKIETPEFCNRPPDHWEKVLGACRLLLAPQDTLIHLGDVIFYEHERLQPALATIPCRKILVLGNHDRKSRGWYERNGFDFAVEMFSRTYVKQTVAFTHKPVPVTGGVINIHGHCHHKTPTEPWWGDNHRLVSLELHGYRPQRVIDVLARGSV